MQKPKKAILASIAIFAMMAMTIPVGATEHSRGDMPAENDVFWTLFALMDHPTDYTNCEVAVTAYVNELGYDAGRTQEELQGMLGFCTGVASMPADMQSSMTAEEVETTLFDNSNWHHINGLYFKKSENGVPMGKISFSHEIDFMTYDFMTFMNNFGNMVQFNDGYISLNAAMIPTMINYGTTFTMYGLHFPTQPDIYVTTAGGSTMRKANSSDISGISYNAATGELSFTPGHFSAFKAVAKGTKVKKMKISSVKPKTVKYNAGKSTFTITVKGTSLYSASGLTCMLGFNSANVVRSNKKGKKITCQFDMSEFSVKGWYPLAVTASGVGEVRKTNGVKIK